MISITRRSKFTAFTILYIFSLMIFDFVSVENWVYLSVFALVIFHLNLLVQYPTFRKSDIMIISYLPLTIGLSTLLGLINFPNLNLFFKYSLILLSGGLFYVSCLINNLVLAEKTEDSSLPLFRVGLVWIQILLIILTIPIITAIYKLDLRFYYHSALVMGYLFISTHVYLHTLLISRKQQEISTREYLTLLFQVALVPTILSLGTSLFEAETFLRATLITSIYMGMVAYLRNYIENSLNKRILWQYGLISLIFLITFFIFSL